jgi:hypothetical protein
VAVVVVRLVTQVAVVEQVVIVNQHFLYQVELITQ